MKRRKLLITLLIMCTFMSLFMIKSFAASTFSVNMTPSSTRVAKGEEFVVTVKLSRISVDGGIAVVRGTLKFDSDVVTVIDATGINGWSGKYLEDSTSVLFDNATAVRSDTEIGTIRFKMSETTSATTAAIRLVSIEGGNATLSDPIKITDITTNITLDGGGTTPSPTTTPTGKEVANTNATVFPTTKVTPTPNTQTPSQKPSQSPSISAPLVVDTPIPVNNTPKNTTTNDNIPKTGTDGYVIPLMAFIATLGIISFVNYKKLNEK